MGGNSGGGGSGSSGGGGSSGTVDYPEYMKSMHGTWLGYVNSDILAARSASPYVGLVAYDPSSDLTIMNSALSELEVLVDNLNSHTDYDTALANATAAIDSVLVPASYIASLVEAQSDVLDTEYDGKIYPAFEAGMRDINAVMTSSFVLGRSLIGTERASKIDKFSADLQMQNHAKRADLITQAVSEMIRLLVQKIELTRAWTSMTVDIGRLSIAAYGDEATENKIIDVADAKWDLETYQYGANVMASIGGGTSTPAKVEGNQMARVVGGALSGASAGALIGSRVGGEGGYGGAIGALVGGIAGALGAGQ